MKLLIKLWLLITKKQSISTPEIGHITAKEEVFHDVYIPSEDPAKIMRGEIESYFD